MVIYRCLSDKLFIEGTEFERFFSLYYRLTSNMKEILCEDRLTKVQLCDKGFHGTKTCASIFMKILILLNLKRFRVLTIL